MVNPGTPRLEYKVAIFGERGDWWCTVTGPDGTEWDSGAFEYAYQAREAAMNTIESSMDNYLTSDA